MPNHRASRIRCLILAFVFLMLTTHCCGIRTTASVKRKLSMYKKTAIIWQGKSDPLHETLFLSYWMDNFPNQTILERKELPKLIREQNFLRRRIDSATRTHVREILGVDAIIIVRFLTKRRNQFYEETYSDLTIKILDTRTGEISASVISKGNSNCNDSIIIESIRKIREQMDKKLYRTSHTNRNIFLPRETETRR